MMRAVAAVLLGILVPSGSAGVVRPDLERIGAQLEAIAASGRFSGAVLIAKDGHPVFRRAYGLADRQARSPNTLRTRFNLASVGKTFTGVAIAQLVQAGKVRFGDPVGRYVPELPSELRRVTIAQLLDHTSGLGDFFADPGYDALKPRLTRLASYLPLIAGEHLAFVPGSRFGYSNSGYLLLGLVVERASGSGYYSYLAKHVFGPAGMTRSGCFWKDRPAPDRAVGYTPDGAANTDSLPPRGTSAGGCYSTAGDLFRFSRALLGHRLLSARLTRMITSTKIAAPGGGYGYGFGIRTGRPGDAPTIWHNGGAPGIGAEIDLNPKLGYAVVVLANLDYATIAPAIDLILDSLRIP
jgi:D-alanyl-D-alanine carboxypeptidase